MPPPPIGKQTPHYTDTTGYGQQVGGTHPTRMRTCFVIVFAYLVNFLSEISGILEGRSSTVIILCDISEMNLFACTIMICQTIHSY